MSLTDWGFELDGLSFGCGTTVEVTKWEPSAGDPREQDVLSSFGDVRIFGRDQVSPAAWSFTLTIKEQDEATALTTLAQLEAAWRNPGVRLTPQAVSTLRYRIGGRRRLVYGRPRRFTPVLTNLIFGRVPVVCDFALAHLGSFEDDGQASQTLTLGASELGGSGVTFPVTFPVLWGGTVASPRHTTINVGGARDAHLTATITAGVEFVTDPYVIVSGQTVQLEGTLGPSQQAVVRGTPWDAGVFQADGTASSLTLSAGSRLADLTVAPGQHEVSFGGIDGSGTATCEVSWHDAQQSI